MKSILLLLLSFLTLAAFAQTPLGGTYTVNPYQAASSTNFTTIGGAIGAIETNGIYAPVTISIATGTYVESLEMGDYSGWGTGNWVTYKSAAGHQDSVKIISSKVGLNPQTLHMDNANYITFKDLTFQTDSTEQTTIFMVNGCDYDSFTNCKIIGSQYTYLNLSAINYPTHLVFLNDSFIGGQFGLYLYGVDNSNNYGHHYTIENCKFQDQTDGGLSVTNADTFWVKDNTFKSNVNDVYHGITIDATGGSGEVTGNDIQDIYWGFGLHIKYVGYYQYGQLLVANNFISSHSNSYLAVGVSIYYCKNIKFYHNSMNLGSSSVYCTSIHHSDSLDIRNNIFRMADNPYYQARTHYIFSSSFLHLDYNCYYTPANVFAYVNNTTNYNTLADWQYYMNLDSHSVHQEVEFDAEDDLHHSTTCLLGTSLADVTTDIDGETRNVSSPTIGADEVLIYAYNAAVTAILSPPGTSKNSTTNYQVKAVVKNLGSTSITSLDMNYSVNGNVTSQTFSGLNIGLCESDTVVFSDSCQLPDEVDVFRTYSGNINGSNADADHSNDTLEKTMYSAMRGVYTIDPGGSGNRNFLTFNAASTALTLAGVDSHVVFNVASGTYNEGVIFESITGTSSSNTITIQSTSGNHRDVLLEYQPNHGDTPGVLVLNGIDHTTFRNLSINCLSGGSYNSTLLIRNNSDYDSISRCNLNNEDVSGSVVTGEYLQQNGNYLVLKDDSITGGYMGVSIIGDNSSHSHGFTAQGNAILHFGENGVGINLGYIDSININDNRIQPDTTLSSTAYTNGIFIYQSDDIISINNNWITDIHNGNGIAISDGVNHGGGSANTLVANNWVQVGMGSSPGSAIYLYNYTYLDLVHNSVNSTFDDNTGQGTALYAYYLNNCTIRNNIFMAGGGWAADWNSNTNIDIDYNVWHTSSSIFGQIDGAPVADFEAFQTAIVIDSNDVKRIIIMFNPRELTHRNACITGLPVTGVTTDFNGVIRSTTDPIIGATETVVPVDYEVELVEPQEDFSSSIVTTETYPIKFLVRNLGGSTVTSLKVVLDINGSQTSETFSSLSLTTCDTLTLTFSSQASFSSLVNDVKIFIDEVNDSTDEEPRNDTLYRSYFASLKGIYTVGPTSSGSRHFATIQGAIDTMNIVGIDSNVVFKIDTGTYDLGTYDVGYTLNAVNRASISKKVTFTSATGNANDVRINGYDGGYLFYLDGGSHFSFEDLTLTINPSAAMYHSSVFQQGYVALDDISIKDCKLQFNGNFDDNDGGCIEFGNYYPLSRVKVINNEISGGNILIALFGSYANNDSGNVVSGNSLHANYGTGILAQGLSGVRIDRNQILFGHTYWSDGAKTGIHLAGCNGNNVISNNSVCGFEGGHSSTSSNYRGGEGIKVEGNIYNSTDSVFIINNQLTSGPNTSYNYGSPVCYGIENSSNNNVMVYHNAVWIRTEEDSVNLAIAYSEYGSNGSNVFNNIFANSTNGLRFKAESTGSYTFDFNMYYSSGGHDNAWFDGVYTNSLADWRTESGQDKHSYFGDPHFMDTLTLIPDTTNTNCWAANGTGRTNLLSADPSNPSAPFTDIRGVSRSTTSALTEGAVDIGAYQFTPNVAPPNLVAEPSSSSANDSQEFFVGDRHIATIYWGASGTPPSVDMKYYSGVNPAVRNGCSTTGEPVYSYWNVEATGGSGGWTYDIKLFYDHEVLAGVEEHQLGMNKSATGNCTWTVYDSSNSGTGNYVINTEANWVLRKGLNSFSDFGFGGNNNNQPLPVTMLSLAATAKGNDALVTWQTGSELNSEKFEVQRSLDGLQFEKVGEVTASGNSTAVRSYAFLDLGIATKLTNDPSLSAYYRISTVDRNGESELSQTVSLSMSSQPTTAILNASFTNNGNELLITFPEKQTGGVLAILYDIQGRNVMQQNANGKQMKLDTRTLSAGMYVLLVGDEKLKLVKE